MSRTKWAVYPLPNVFLRMVKSIKLGLSKQLPLRRQTLSLLTNHYRYIGWDNCIGTSSTIKNILLQITSQQESEYAKITLHDLKRLRDEAIVMRSS